jgi:hypothetical protein
MSHITRRNTSAALTLATLLALPLAPAAAAPARTAPGAASTVRESWRFLADLLGFPYPGTASRTRQGQGQKPRVGKLGGYIDPDGRTYLLGTNTTLVKP